MEDQRFTESSEVPEVPPEALGEMREVAKRFHAHLNGASDEYLKLQELASAGPVSPNDLARELDLDGGFIEMLLTGVSLEAAIVGYWDARGERPAGLEES